MSGNYLIILLVLFAVAAVLQGDYVFTVIYLFAGAMFFGQWWSVRVLDKTVCQRRFERRAFLGEDVPVRLEVRNPSILPVVWLHLYDSLPPELAIPNTVNRVTNLGPRATLFLDYTLHARKRGYYKVGPLFISSGDILGFSDEGRRASTTDYLTVYPHIVGFSRMDLPSSSPQGTLRHSRPIFEDPTRVLSKRDYIAGDSLRRVDWKATAVVGRLQVKQFEPSIALETAIFLNLNSAEYPSQSMIDATELGIVVAASVANWVAGQKQAVGLTTNGVDPFDLEEGGQFRPVRPLPPRKGRGHLMRLLDILARIQTGETQPLVDVLRRECPGLSWGATLILVTGLADDALFDELFQVRRRGLNVVLFLVGRVAGGQEARDRARHFGITLYLIQTENDLLMNFARS